MTDSWHERQQLQTAGFNAFATRYDEVFPHEESQVRMAKLGELGVRTAPGLGTGSRTVGRRPHGRRP